jgi:hypothetical protein
LEVLPSQEGEDMSFTKKPWRLRDWDVMGGDNSIVASIVPWDSSGCRQEDHANARLIAAAPELYELLQEILSCACSYDAGHYREIQVPYGLTEDIVAVIKKATGE